MTTLKRGCDVLDKELLELYKVARKFRFVSGRLRYLQNLGRFSEIVYEQEQPMTNSAAINAILEQQFDNGSSF